MDELKVTLLQIALLPGALCLDGNVIAATLSCAEKLRELEKLLDVSKQANFTITTDVGSFSSINYGRTWTRILSPQERTTLKAGRPPFKLATLSASEETELLPGVEYPITLE
ncbi:MAG: hypothetical protein IH820_15615, partial [Bacteroidetes bacterium]|nr:hypothetical protein [Bacteroidota bacterium]